MGSVDNGSGEDESKKENLIDDHSCSNSCSSSSSSRKSNDDGGGNSSERTSSMDIDVNSKNIDSSDISRDSVNDGEGTEDFSNDSTSPSSSNYLDENNESNSSNSSSKDSSSSPPSKVNRKRQIQHIVNSNSLTLTKSLKERKQKRLKNLKDDSSFNSTNISYRNNNNESSKNNYDTYNQATFQFPAWGSQIDPLYHFSYHDHYLAPSLIRPPTYMFNNGYGKSLPPPPVMNTCIDHHHPMITHQYQTIPTLLPQPSLPSSLPSTPTSIVHQDQSLPSTPTLSFEPMKIRLTYSKMLSENNSRYNRGDSLNIWGSFVNTSNNEMHYATGHTFTIGGKNSNFIAPFDKNSNNKQLDNDLIIWCRVSSYVNDSSHVIIESFVQNLFKINDNGDEKLLKANKPTLLNSTNEISFTMNDINYNLIYLSSNDLVSNAGNKSLNQISKSTSHSIKKSEFDSNSYYLNIYHDIDNNGMPIKFKINSNLNYNHSHSQSNQTQQYHTTQPISNRPFPFLPNTFISPTSPNVNNPIVVNLINQSNSVNNSNNIQFDSVSDTNNIHDNENINKNVKSSPYDRELLLELLKQSLVDHNDIQYDLNSFPYYLCDSTKELLINSGNFFLNCSDFVKYSHELSTIDRRILLDGPLGTDIYQESLVKSLAKHFKSNLLILDSSFFDVNKYKNLNYSPPITNNVNNNNINNNNNNYNVNNPFKTSNNNNIYSIYGNKNINHANSNGYGSTLDDLELRPHWYQIQTKHIIMESRRKLNVGDKVKFFSLGGHIMNESRKLTSPPQGCRGKVVIANDQLNLKVGIKFEKTFVGGNTLNGLLSDNSGYFTNSYDLKIDEYDSETSLDYFFFSNLLEFIKGLDGPIIIYILELEKTMLSHLDRVLVFKEDFSNIVKSLPVLIITGIINIDKDKKETNNNSLIGNHGSSYSGNFNLPNAPQLPSLPRFSMENPTLIKSFFDNSDRYRYHFDSYNSTNNLKHDNNNNNNNSNNNNNNNNGISSTTFSNPLSNKLLKLFYKLFPFTIRINTPSDRQQLEYWNNKIERDNDNLRLNNNKVTLRKIISKNNLNVSESDLNLIEVFKKQIFTLNQLDSIISWSLLNYFNMNNNSNVEIVNEKLTLPIKSIEYGVSLWKNLENQQSFSSEKDKPTFDLKNIETENEFEKKLLSDVIAPEDISVKFNDIGALDKVKDVLKELVMLPLQRPELFRRGNLTKPVKGILLFGPPGTGKTMLAKSVASESGAHFLNISMSSISSKWFGEGEKFAKAVFTLASKLSPCVIFIDEVDAVLGKRDSKEHEAMRKIKNEFMTLWDGLKTKESERVLVLAATNRPFDIDEAVLRRFRKLLIDLPDEENRFKILQVILENEELVENFDMKSIAKLASGFSGSDLKTLSIAAAYQPIRELLAKEKELKNSPHFNPNTDLPLQLRPINNGDFINALKEISPSVSEEASSIAELRKWNEMFGESGKGFRISNIPSYFM